MNFFGLYEKSEPTEVYSIVIELRWIFKVFSFADIAENMLYYTKQACVLLSNHIFRPRTARNTAVITGHS